ncbi:MAG: dCTP deaminase domain-containing protein [Gammaproteobacteria bacterium]
MDEQTVGARILQWLEENGWTQKKLAARMGLSAPVVNYVITGSRRASDGFLRKLADITDVDLDEWTRLRKDQNLRRPQFVDDPRRHELLVERWRRRGIHTLTDRHIIEGMDTGAFTVEPFDDEALEGDTIDLCMESTLLLRRAGTPCEQHLSEEQDLLIHEGDLFIARTQELINLPGFIRGRCSLKSELSQQGVIANGGAVVDPGYRGRLFLTMKHHGAAPLELSMGALFLTLTLEFLPEPPKQLFRDDDDNPGRTEFTETEYATVGGNRPVRTNAPEQSSNVRTLKSKSNKR